MNQFRIKKQLDLPKPLNKTLPDSWNKIQVINNWDEVIGAFSKAGKIFNSNWNFANQEVIDDFRKFINPETKFSTSNRSYQSLEDINLSDCIDSKWISIASFFKQEGKLFKDNSGWIASSEAHEFLSKYTADQPLTIRYSLGDIFPCEEFESDRITLNDQVELVSNDKFRQKREIVATTLAVASLAAGIAGTVASSLGAYFAWKALPSADNSCYIELIIENCCPGWDFYLDEFQGIDTTQIIIPRNSVITYINTSSEAGWKGLETYLKFKCTRDLYKQGSVDWSDNAFYVFVNSNHDNAQNQAILKVRTCEKDDKLITSFKTRQDTATNNILTFNWTRSAGATITGENQVAVRKFFNSQIYAGAIAVEHGKNINKLKILKVKLQIGGDPFSD